MAVKKLLTHSLARGIQHIYSWISWTCHTTNDDILLKADKRQKLLKLPLGWGSYNFSVMSWERKKWKSCLLPEKEKEKGTEEDNGKTRRVVCYWKNRRGGWSLLLAWVLSNNWTTNSTTFIDQRQLCIKLLKCMCVCVCVYTVSLKNVTRFIFWIILSKNTGWIWFKSTDLNHDLNHVKFFM